jgi:leucyl-tRNA synthetase
MDARSPDNGRPAGGYDFEAVELKWQARWAEAGVNATPDPTSGRPCYVFNTPPFTSGEAHMGHVRSNAIGDSFARFRRARGDAVLYSLGFDAFGLPSELGAIAHDMTPQEWVEQCCERMQAQFTRLGFSHDWERSFVSSDPEMYRWSQWLFLKLREKDLIYQREGQVEWCASCRTVLANLQVEDGRCWRCDEPVELVNRNQWYLRRSAYNQESFERLAEMTEWEDNALAAQRATLGPVEGVEFEAKGLDGAPVTLFTTFPEAIGEAEFVLISPNHPQLDCWTAGADVAERLKALRRGGGRREERRDANLLAVDTGAMVMVPGVEAPLPVLISPSVDGRVGATALLGIPSQDETDKRLREFVPDQKTGLKFKGASGAPKTKPAIRFRADDFTISRQRAWGAPIPLVHCEKCGTVPVPLSDLPVRLPDNLASEPGAGLDRFPEFLECSCPSCGERARREADTLDCHIDAAWSHFPEAVPPEARSEDLFDHPDLRHWIPVRQLVQGADNGQFSLNMRLGGKLLRDIGAADYLPDGEPFRGALMHEMVQKDGRKMSKHLGNVVAPQDVVAEHGADAVRFAVLYAAAPGRAFDWNDQALRYCTSFLAKFRRYAQPRLEARTALPQGAAIDSGDKLRSRLSLWCDTAIKRITQHYEALEMHQVTRNLIRFFERVESFEERVEKQRGKLGEEDLDAQAIALLQVTRMLAPVSPHLAEELWSMAGREGFACQAPWPEPSPRDKDSKKHDQSREPEYAHS